MKLGYIGLGNMGGALARRPMREHQLRAFDLRPEVLGRFAERGAVPTQSAQARARENDLIMTCLPTSAEVRDVLFGEGRVAEVLQPGQIFADMTTGDPGETRDVAARLAEGGEDDRRAGQRRSAGRECRHHSDHGRRTGRAVRQGQPDLRDDQPQHLPHRWRPYRVLANVVRELFQTAINEHGADKDTQTLVKLFERNAGVAIAPRN
jgi:NAD binding domain of 6-phosphogluconate dehydrogenase